MRYTEAQIRKEACKELLNSPGQTLSTSKLIIRLEARMTPVGKDAAVAGERNDTYFSQKVRNLVCHRRQSTGLEARGIADYDKPSASWTLTPRGRSYASNLR